jgi:hypothetical protein
MDSTMYWKDVNSKVVNSNNAKPNGNTNR